MESKQITVKIDDRIRLVSAVLSLTNYPEQSQARKKHGTHPHARGTRRHLHAYADHPCVQQVQQMLNQSVPVSTLFGLVLTPTNNLPDWVPTGFTQSLADFYQKAGLREWWEAENIAWTTALRQLKEAFARIELHTLFKPFFGDIHYHLTFTPSLCYPTDLNIGIRMKTELTTIMPPPQAWGDSAPWAYKDDPALAYRAAIYEYGALLIDDLITANNTTFQALSVNPLPVNDKYIARFGSWRASFTSIFTAALTAIFLENTMGRIEARSYLQYMGRVEGLTSLPHITEAFSAYLEAWRSGQTTGFMPYLPTLLNQMQATTA